MKIIPAIDLKDGCVVRLVQGEFSRSKVYSSDAVSIAREWAAQGAAMIHVVDLDGAASGIPKNIDLARRIAAQAGIPVQFGGGVRDMAAIESLLAAGINRVILGTRAAEDEAFLREAFSKFPGRIIVSLDAAGDKVMVKGWLDSRPGLDALDFARSLKKTGFNELIYTDVRRDGTLKGPNIEGIKKLIAGSGMRVITSGGISELEDIIALCSLEETGVSGIITGKALYEKRFTLREAVSAAANFKPGAAGK